VLVAKTDAELAVLGSNFRQRQLLATEAQHTELTRSEAASAKPQMDSWRL